MAPYYRRALHLSKPSPELVAHLHLDWLDHGSQFDNENAPIKASFPGELGDKLPGIWIETLESLGYKLSGNPFDGHATGPFHSPSTVDPATTQRSHSLTGYYDAAKDRPNLKLMTGVVVKKILLEGKEKDVEVKGVIFSQDGKDFTATAHREVILAAGALQSPKILELSGIGDEKLLKKLGIETRIDNPYVGENLQDHPMTGLSFETVDGVRTMDSLLRQEPDAIQEAFGAYQSTQSGFLRFGGVDSYALMPVPGSLDDDWREVFGQLLEDSRHAEEDLAHPAGQLYHDFTVGVFQSPDEASASVFCTRVQHSYTTSSQARDLVTRFRPENFYSISSFLLYPLSRGSVHIESADASRHPIVDPRYFSHPLDKEIFARHIQHIERIAAASPFKSLLKENGVRNADNAYVTSIEAAKEYISRSTLSGWHLSSTCAMLPRELGGVVAQTLLVYGTKNLRVVDASVMPIVTGGNPQTSVYAVAERASDIIKEAYGWSEKR